MFYQHLLRVFVGLFSAAWLLPLGLGVNAYLRFMEAELLPLLAWHQHPLNSFPFLAFSRECFTVAFIWLGLVVMAWAYWGFGLIKTRSK